MQQEGAIPREQYDARSPGTRVPSRSPSNSMWYGLLLSLPVAVQPSHTIESLRSSPTSLQQPPQSDPEFDKRRTAAGNDVDKLWDVYKWCKEQKKDEKGRSVLRQILKIDPNHEDANLALGYVKYEGKWFPSQKKVDDYKKEQEAKQNKADGLVEYKGQRVPPADVPFLEKGMVKDDTGKWVDGEEYQKKKDGWIRQDLTWVDPKEKENIDKGLWKCGDKWLSLEEANKFHSEPGEWWRIPTDHYRLYTTCDRALAMDKIKVQLDRAWDDLQKIYQVEPPTPPIVVVLRDDRQYNAYAGGDEEAGVQPTDTRGIASEHYAYFSEIAPDANGLPMLAGVGYWDASADAGDRWGTCSVRSALGLSYADAIDPSTSTVEKAKKKKAFEKGYVDQYYEEKRLPEWFRQGAATYVERYYVDIYVGRDGDNAWTRKWSVTNIVNKGGLRSLKQITDPKADYKAGDVSKLMNEMGLVMAFVVDGKCAPVTEKLKAVQEALKANKDKKELHAAAQALADEVLKHETDLRKFAGI